jgi:hypothetical protein
MEGDVHLAGMPKGWTGEERGDRLDAAPVFKPGSHLAPMGAVRCGVVGELRPLIAGFGVFANALQGRPARERANFYSKGLTMARITMSTINTAGTSLMMR